MWGTCFKYHKQPDSCWKTKINEKYHLCTRRQKKSIFFSLFLFLCCLVEVRVEEFQIIFQVHGVFSQELVNCDPRKLNGPLKFSSTPFQPILSFHLSASQQVLLNHPSPRSKRDSYIIWIQAGINKNQAWSIDKQKKQKWNQYAR